MTNVGSRDESSSIVGIEYPFSGTPPTPIELKVNRDHEFQSSVLEQAKNFIYSINGWSPIITGSERQKSSLGGDSVLNTYITYNNSTILPKQRFYADMWNWILCEVFKVINGEEITQGIKFNSTLAKMIDDLKEIKGTTEKQEDDDITE
jgi:hypothetical protein